MKARDRESVCVCVYERDRQTNRERWRERTSVCVCVQRRQTDK